MIGRDDEVERVVSILARRSKNNPVLIGEPGVGKTAIVEGLAQRIARGDVPAALRDKRVLALSLGPLVAGTKYRGEFEGRVKRILDEVKRAGARHHPVHRRAAHAGRCRRRGRFARPELDDQAGARARRAAVHRRDDVRRVPQVRRVRRRARTPLSARASRRADDRADRRDPARAAREVRRAPRRHDRRRRRSKPPRRSRRATSPTAICPTRRSTSSTKRLRGAAMHGEREVDVERVAAVVSRWTGIPQGTITDAQRAGTARARIAARDARRRPEPGRARGLRGDSPRPRRAQRSAQAGRRVLVRRPERRRQDRARARARPRAVRHRRRADPARPLRVHRSAHDLAAARRAARLSGTR